MPAPSLGLISPGLRSPIVRFALAVVTVATALGLHLGVVRIAPDAPRWAFFFIATMTSALLLGRAAGVTALLLGALAGSLFVPAPGAGAGFALVSYLVVGSLTVAVVSALQALRARSQEAERRYATLVEHMPDVVSRLDRDLRHLYISPSVEAVAGVPAAQFLGRTGREVGLPPEACDVMEPALADALASRRETVIEWRLGDRHLRSRLVPEEAGTLLAITEDVTERRAGEEALVRSEAALREGKERLRRTLDEVRAVTDLMAAAVTRCSKDRRYLWVSRMYAEGLGLAPEAIVGRPISEVIGEDAARELEPHFERVLRGERVAYDAEVDYRGIGRRWINAVYVPTLDRSGAADGWVAVVTDITHRKDLELAIEGARRAAEARLREARALMDANRQLSQSLDTGELLDTLCRVARELVGADGATFVLRERDHVHYAAENAIGPLWKGRRFPIGQCISGWAMLEKGTAVVEDVYADPRIPVEAYRSTFVRSLLMVPVHRAEPLGAMGAYWATQRRPTRDEIGLLEALADLASIAVQNARFFEEVQSASRAKDEFLAMLSHELRNPLAPIRNAVQVLQTVGSSVPAIERARGDDRSPGRAHDPAGRRPPRGVAHHARQDRPAHRAAHRRRRDRGGRRDRPPGDRAARAHALRRRRHRAAVGERRSGTARPGDGEPAGERRQVHAPRRTHHGGDGADTGREGRRARARHGHRRTARDAGEDLRPVHPGGGDAGALAGRPRDRAHAGPTAGRAARRLGRGPERRTGTRAPPSRSSCPPSIRTPSASRAQRPDRVRWPDGRSACWWSRTTSTRPRASRC